MLFVQLSGMALNQIDELMEDCKHPVQGGDPMLSSHSSHLLSSAPHSPRSDASVIYGNDEIDRVDNNNSSRQLHHHHQQQRQQQLHQLAHHHHHHHPHRESEHSAFSMLSDPLLCSSQRSHGSVGGGGGVVVDDDHQNSVDLSGSMINDSMSSLVDESVHTESMYVPADALDIDHL